MAEINSINSSIENDGVPCECGCGAVPPLRRYRGRLRFIPGHQNTVNLAKGRPVSGERHPCWNGGRSSSSPYEMLRAPDHPRADSRGYVQEHVLIAEKALGRVLLEPIVVHHVDENRRNNINSNLVICENQAYHLLLHMRARALRDCGHADWRRCSYCKSYSLTGEIDIYRYKGKSQSWHLSCQAAAGKAKRDAKRQIELGRVARGESKSLGQRISERQMGEKNHRFGTHPSEETRHKASESMKRRPARLRDEAGKWL